MASMYVLFSESRKRYYIGSTDNLEQRLVMHNQGRVRSTKAYVPWKLIYHEEFSDRGSAQKREYQVKSYKGGAAFKRLLEKDCPASGEVPPKAA